MFTVKQILINIRNSNMKTFLLLVLSIIALAIAPVTGFSQCTVTNQAYTGFEDGTLNITSGAQSGGTATSQYTGPSCGGGHWIITTNSNSSCGGGPITWKDGTTTASTVGGHAMEFDGGGASNPENVWCYSINVSAGQIYDFSALYSSPWGSLHLTGGNDNNPMVTLTINGVAITPGVFVDQYNEATNAETPYKQQACYYKIPTGTSGSIPFCVSLTQYTGGETNASCPTCVPVVGANSQGNDLLLDDISIDLVSGGGCPAAGTCTYTLPVNLLTFKGTKSGSKATLYWVTASEKNSSYFSVEKSDDGINFSEIGIVSAQGTSNNIVNYKFDDDHFNKLCYYRLKMVDKDGSFTYSSVQFLETGNSSARIIKTESGEMEIRASVNEDTRWNIAVYSLLGQEYTNQNVQLTKGENTLLKGVSWGERSAKIVRITSLDGSVILSQVAIW
jgi:hypothetical protein